MPKHKNSNDAVGNYCIYVIEIKSKIYKTGKADLDRISASSGIPTRIHQQIRILRELYKTPYVYHTIVRKLLGISTRQAKRVERALLEEWYKEHNDIPEGNTKSFKQKKMNDDANKYNRIFY